MTDHDTWTCLRCNEPLREKNPFPVPVGRNLAATVACAACGPEVPKEDLLAAVFSLLENWPAFPKPAEEKRPSKGEEDLPPPATPMEYARRAVEYWHESRLPGETPVDAWMRLEAKLREAAVRKRKAKLADRSDRRREEEAK